MSCGDKSGGISPELEAPRRNNFYYGKLMDVLHFQMEQDYGNAKRALINRLSLGDGVLCGLAITAVDATVCVGPGVAIDALGREIVVAAPVCIDPWAPPDPCGPTKPPRPRDQAQVVTICLAYYECLTDYRPVMVPDCDTKEKCAAGTVVESFRLLVMDGEPPPVTADLPMAACKQFLVAPAKDRRQVLCEALSGDCETPSADPCVPLARVELLPDGTIGEITVCQHRPRVYSNAILFDLILCLAARLDECCGEAKPTPKPTPTPTPTPTPKPSPTLKVQAVHLIAGAQEVAALHPGPVSSVFADNVDSIRVTFNQAVDASTVIPASKDGEPGFATFLVERVDQKGGTAVSGTIVPVGLNQVRFALARGVLTEGEYRITLFGTVARGRGAILDLNKRLLDGEPLTLPSGDGKPGGDFVISFRIALHI